MKEDLDIADSKANLETIQQHINSKIVNSVQQKHGIPKVIIARHILEHTYDTHQFMSALKQMVDPFGYIIFESGHHVLDFASFKLTAATRR